MWTVYGFRNPPLHPPVCGFFLYKLCKNSGRGRHSSTPCVVYESRPQHAGLSSPFHLACNKASSCDYSKLVSVSYWVRALPETGAGGSLRESFIWGLVRDLRDHPGVLEPLGGKPLCFISALCLCSVCILCSGWESGAIAVLVLRTLSEWDPHSGTEKRGG